jgi:hypothetical protein
VRRTFGFGRLLMVLALLVSLGLLAVIACAGAATTATLATGAPYRPAAPSETCGSPNCPITINDNASTSQDQAATPYPSDICCVVFDPGVSIDTITVTITGLTHGSLDNVDVLLVPAFSGPAVELMSDVGGLLPATNLNLTFDDSAPSSLPQNASPSSGTYKPTNYPGSLLPCVGDSPPLSPNSDPFPSSAPPPPQGGYSQTLSSLHGAGFGGFHLYVGDDCVGGTGAISGWSFNVTFIECPDLCLIKKADAVTASAGSSIGFTLDAYNNYFECPFPIPEECDIHGVTLDDPLPAGPGVNWSISPTYMGPGTCSITGAVGTQRLSCSFGDFQFHSGFARVHISSPTAPSTGCGTYSNTATLSASDASTVQDTTSITVTGCPTAVSLSSLAAIRSKRGVLVRWRTASEAGTLGFNVYRERAGRLLRVNPTLVPSVFGGSTNGHTYSWLDRTAPRRGGTLKYRLESLGLDGTRHWAGAAFAAR